MLLYCNNKITKKKLKKLINQSLLDQLKIEKWHQYDLFVIIYNFFSNTVRYKWVRGKVLTKNFTFVFDIHSSSIHILRMYLPNLFAMNLSVNNFHKNKTITYFTLFYPTGFKGFLYFTVLNKLTIPKSFFFLF
jgi:hypothetical protein